MQRLVLILLMLIGSPALAEETHLVNADHVEVALIAEKDGLTQGVNWLGLRFRPEADWHTYWSNPGDSGEPPTMEWQLPEFAQAGEIQWPIPHAIPVAHLTNYGYDGEVLLMVPITIDENPLAAGSVDITVSASWLVCKEDCIPGWADLTLTLPLQDSANPSPDAPLFDATRGQLPQLKALEAEFEITDSNITVALPLNTDIADQPWQLLPTTSGIAKVGVPQQFVTDDTLLMVLPKATTLDSDTHQLALLLFNDEIGYYLRATANEGMVQRQGSPVDIPAMGALLLMAFAGGLLLNIMPCVLPVLAIKAIQVDSSSSNRATGIAYLGGVMATFMALAGVIIQLKGIGSAVGWGFHLQNPVIVALLAVLFLAIALNLFELGPQGTGLMGVGQSLTQGSKLTSSFFTGALAVVVASPCTAPFMATALGVALVSDNAALVLIFTALGLGFALPLVAITSIPVCSRWIPKPGAWMIGFRQFLAFPMLAAVLWLLWVYAQLSDEAALFALMAAMLVFSLFMWSWSKANTPMKTVLMVSTVLVLGYGTQLNSSDKEPEVANRTVLTGENFSRAAIEQLRQQHPVVFVNITADWCITCKVNEQVAFASDDVQEVLAAGDIHYVEVDWTRKEPEILAYLQAFGRVGVPLYLIYQGNNPPVVLPQILTPGIVVQGLTQAQQELTHVSI